MLSPVGGRGMFCSHSQIVGSPQGLELTVVTSWCSSCNNIVKYSHPNPSSHHAALNDVSSRITLVNILR